MAGRLGTVVAVTSPIVAPMPTATPPPRGVGSAWDERWLGMSSTPQPTQPAENRRADRQREPEGHQRRNQHSRCPR